MSCLLCMRFFLWLLIFTHENMTLEKKSINRTVEKNARDLSFLNFWLFFCEREKNEDIIVGICSAVDNIIVFKLKGCQFFKINYSLDGQKATILLSERLLEPAVG